MAQIFEVTWSEGTVTPGLISSLLRQYVTQGGLYGTIVVKEASQQGVQADTPKRCGCGYTFQSHIPNCLQCGAVNPAYR